MEPNEIEVKVSYNPSPRYTLSEKRAGDSFEKDCQGALFGNSDKGAFYKAVAQRLADLSAQGMKIIYLDRGEG